jgi:hypothetical protein
MAFSYFMNWVETYKPANVPEVLAAKAGEFWSRTKHASHESVDTYYNHFRELLDDLDQADDRISTKSAMGHFIFTLGPEFESIQNNYRIGNLPLAWQTTDWPSCYAATTTILSIPKVPLLVTVRFLAIITPNV